MKTTRRGFGPSFYSSMRAHREWCRPRTLEAIRRGGGAPVGVLAADSGQPGSRSSIRETTLETTSLVVCLTRMCINTTMC
eukprot:3344241-Pyramimonas_sp.AAC.1